MDGRDGSRGASSMAVQSPAPSQRSAEDSAERLASWLVVYLAALMTSLALVGSVWALGLVPSP